MRFGWHYWSSALILISAMLFLNTLSRSEVIPLRKSLSEIPLHLGAWEGKEGEALDTKVIGILGVEDSLLRIYTRGGGDYLSLYIGYYQSQGHGDSIHSPKHCLPGSGWQPIEDRVVDISLQDGRSVTVNRYLIQKGSEKQLVLYWYQERGRVIANEYMVKLFLVLDAITRNRTDGALVRIIAPVTSSVDETLSFQKEFAQEMFPYLSDSLPE